MLIGELSQKSGFSRDTIRYYEKIGLLKLPKKARRDNNYKEYTSITLARLSAIKQLKNIGYTLHEVQQVIDAYEVGRLDCVTGKQQIIEKVGLIEQQIRQLEITKRQLLEVVTNCPQDCKIINILTDTLVKIE